MELSSLPYLEDWQAHLGAVTVSASGSDFLISGNATRYFLRCSEAELLALIRQTSLNAAAFSTYCRNHPAHQQPRAAASVSLSLADLGI